jgi:hypothetical protein
VVKWKCGKGYSEPKLPEFEEHGYVTSKNERQAILLEET